MSTYPWDERRRVEEDAAGEPEIVVDEVVPELRWERMPYRPIRRRRVWLPAALFVATCLSTLLAGSRDVLLGFDWATQGLAAGLGHALVQGLLYAVPLMTILIFHEMGHFLQARRYGVPASYPYFIPMPVSPIGTFGAVIAMGARMGHRRALFDIGITGPLAGLVPTLVFCVVGLQLSEIGPVVRVPGEPILGAPPLFAYIADQMLGPRGPGEAVHLHPMAFAGWVGLLITSINLFPVGQLDGGHVLYALLRERAHRVASLLMLAAIAAVIYYGLWIWTLMLALLMMMGPAHPPTADDDEPLGLGRHALGWATLAFLPLGFTPVPFF
jgi:membrane-associated protease RseP (regulator of RpoE activity)